MGRHLSILVVVCTLLAACGGQPAAVAPTSAPTVGSTPLVNTPSVPAASPEAAAFPVTVKHQGGELTLDQQPSRVVVCSEEALDFLIVLDIQPVGYCSDRVTGATNGQPYDLPHFFPTEKIGTPTFVGGAASPSIELIATLKPDLIVTGTWTETADQLAQVAPTYVMSVDAPGYWRETLLGLGRLTGRVAQAEQFLSEYDAAVMRFAKEVAPIARQSPNLLLVYSFAASDGTMVLGNDWYGSQPFQQLGFTVLEPAGATFSNGVALTSAETVAQTEADIVFVLRPLLPDGTRPTYPIDPLLDSRTDTRVIYQVFGSTRPSTSPWTDRFVLEEVAGLLST